jgi:hypothetical protein
MIDKPKDDAPRRVHATAGWLRWGHTLARQQHPMD